MSLLVWWNLGSFEIDVIGRTPYDRQLLDSCRLDESRKRKSKCEPDQTSKEQEDQRSGNDITSATEQI
jgi:hypothetical protein